MKYSAYRSSGAPARRWTCTMAAALLLLPFAASAHDERPAHHKVLPENATRVMQAFFNTEQAKQNLTSVTTIDSSSAAPCIGNLADPGTGDPAYPCDGIDLQSFLALDDIGGTQSNSAANDLWGWIAPDGSEYAIIGRVFGTSFVDISTPTNPVYLGNLPTHGAFGSSWRDIKVYQDHAFIVSEAQNHGMQVFDLMQLETVDRGALPVTFGESAYYRKAASSHNLAINEDTGYAFMVGNRGKNNCSGGLHMVDISNLNNAKFAGCYSGDGYTHDVQCVVYHGPDTEHQGKEICVASNEDTVTIVDVTDKANPVLISRTGYTDASYTHQGWLSLDHEFFIVDDELDEYYGQVSNTTTRVFDLLDLDNPVLSNSGASTSNYESGVFTNDTISIDHNLYMVGGCAVEANYRSGLRIIDLRDAIAVGDQPVGELGFFDIWPPDDLAAFNGMWSSYAFFPSGNIIASGIEQGLYVLKPSFDLAAACVLADNEAPVVAITAPEEGANFDEGVEINFTATVEDAEDNPDPTAMWSSSLDGPLDPGNSILVTLSVGSHVITASATDSDGATGSDAISVTVTAVGGGSDMHVASMVGGWIVKTDRRWTGQVAIEIREVGDVTAVDNATVSGRWSGGAKGSSSCVTGSSGTCTVSKRAKLGNNMTFAVTGVTHPTLSYASQGGDSTALTISEGTPAP